MDEEKKNKVSLALVVVVAILGTGVFMYYIASGCTVQTTELTTTELTIEHLWEEGDKYYFADRDGHVYRIGNLRKANEEIMYKDVPKVRFEKFSEGMNYECIYLKGAWRISISEKEIER